MKNQLKAYMMYEKVQAEEHDSGELILMMYSGSIRSLRIAEEFHHKGKTIQKNNEISRAKQIILELLGSINLDAGEIATNLTGIYITLFRKLNKFYIEEDVKIIRDVCSVLEDLESAWKVVFNSDEYARIIEERKKEELKSPRERTAIL